MSGRVRPFVVATATRGDESGIVDEVDVVTDIIADLEAVAPGETVAGIGLSVWAHSDTEGGREPHPIVAVELTKGAAMALIADLLAAVRSL
jgi:hypothetical protein